MKTLYRLYNNFYVTPIFKGIGFLSNLGSMLLTVLGFQLVSGILLLFFYSNSIELAFTSAILMFDMNNFIIIKLIHVIGATLFFGLLYFHLLRGIY